MCKRPKKFKKRSLIGYNIQGRFIGESRGRKIWENARPNALHCIRTAFVIFTGPLPLSPLVSPFPLIFFHFSPFRPNLSWCYVQYGYVFAFFTIEKVLGIFEACIYNDLQSKKVKFCLKDMKTYLGRLQHCFQEVQNDFGGCTERKMSLISAL